MKLIRTLLAVEGKGVCSGVAGDAIVCSGENEGEEDSSGVGEGVGVGDSCASAKEDKMAIATARLKRAERSRDISNCLNEARSTSKIERFDSLASHSLSLWPSRPSRGFPVDRFFDFVRNDRD